MITKTAPKQIAVSFETREVDASKLQVEFIISNYSQDSYGTRFDPAGIDLTQYARNAILTYRHMRDGGIFSLPIGRGLVDTVRKDAQGNIRMTFEFTPEEVFPFGFQVYKLVRDGYLNMGSIGADATREEIITEADGRRTLVFREWKLFEFSVVPIGSNDDALVTKRCADLNITREELLVREKAVADVEAAEKSDEKKISEVNDYLRAKTDTPNADDIDNMDDYKITAECSTTDKGTTINVKMRREKDGKIFEQTHKDVGTVAESADQIKFREYFTANKEVLGEYRDLLALMYKFIGAKQSGVEREAVSGLTKLLATSVQQNRSKKVVKAARPNATQLRMFLTKLVKDTGSGLREALLDGAPVRNIDELIEREFDRAFSISSTQ